MVVLGAAIAIAGVFTTSHRPQDIGGPGLYFVGGGVAAAGIAIAIITDWLGRHYGVRKRKRPSPIDWPWSRQ
jgi:hypothetical protein